ncbi:MAG: hypothetical protein HY287_03910 [Planctomycetes bacterium]|nr:hypothetical protein [Planctomycetota bacterium]MBI3833458.1 hypothetical protein [Planctomycetota bacterium]
MNISVIREYLLDRVSSLVLQRDLWECREQYWVGNVLGTRFHSGDGDLLDSCKIAVEVRHLIKLCDDVLNHALRPCELDTLGFEFESWPKKPGEEPLIGKILACWNAPEINVPLTRENIAKFREWLLTGVIPFTKSDFEEEWSPDSSTCRICRTPWSKAKGDWCGGCGVEVPPPRDESSGIPYDRPPHEREREHTGICESRFIDTTVPIAADQRLHARIRRWLKGLW